MKLIDPKGRVLDVGANIGIMTALLGRKNPQLEIHAFEPIPENFKVLTKVCHKFSIDHVVLHHLALGNSPGSLKMIMPTLGDARQQGLSHVMTDPNEQGQVYDVAVTTLDSLFGADEKRISGIKLDVENFEYFVLEGAKRILRQHKPIIYVELWDNENRTKCINLLSDHGYKPYLFDGNKLQQFSHQNGHNFFFLIEEVHDLLAS
jgi:FkbM family methyltransferase